MIESVAAYPLLTGLRGLPPDALAAALSRFSAANADTIESLDLNPVLVRPPPRSRARTLHVENRPGVVGSGYWVLRRFRAGSGAVAALTSSVLCAACRSHITLADRHMQEKGVEVPMTTQLIGKRIKALREERKLSQEKLAEIFGFNDRQTVSAIETGVRRVTAEELVLAVEKLGTPLEYFTDPFLLAGEGRFSWRQSGVDMQQLEACERRAGRWIAAYRTLVPQVGRETPLMRRTLGLFRRSSFEEAIRAGERFAAEFGLGDVPATRLADVMERELGILVLMVDADRGISGAACRLPELDSVLIARHEVEGRRHFDLAHELFHLLTWGAMPPEHLEEARETGGSRVEQLANNFAAAVLMPAATLARFGGWSELGQAALVARLNAAANELHVTASALRWRLVALGALTPAIARAVPDAALRHNGRDEAEHVPPALFSRPFVEVLGLAIGDGLVSMRRAATLLELSVDDLSDLFAVHGVAQPAEL